VSAPGPARARAAAALVGVALAAAAAASPTDAQPGQSSSRLAVEAPGWALEGRAVELRVEPRGALAGRPLTLTVVVDGHAVDRLASDGGRTRVRIDAGHLAPGRHRIGVKTGTEASFVELRVVARRALWLPAGVALLLAALAIRAALGRRRRAS
jgi:hypothetical protein